MPRKIIHAFIAYIKDWKNLLFHSLAGLTILAVALFVPIHPVFRALFLIAVIAFNIFRIRLEKTPKSSKKITEPVKIPISDD